MSNPIFIHLMTKYAELREAGLDRTEEASILFEEMMRYAPPEYQQIAHEMIVEAGLMPEKPDCYSDDGEPLYDLAGIAKRLGVEVADIPERFKERAHQGKFNRAH
jgi:hypothetical protein